MSQRTDAETLMHMYKPSRGWAYLIGASPANYVTRYGAEEVSFWLVLRGERVG